MKIFTAITTQIENNKVVAIQTSNGGRLYRKQGLSLKRILDFFFELRCRKDVDEVFICYAFQSDNEYIFSSLPTKLKDKLFQSYNFRRDRGEVEEELDELDYKFFNAENDTQSKEELDFNRYVNKLSLKEFNDIKYQGYELYLINGKILTITRNKIKFILYDVYGYFRSELKDAVKVWLEKELPINEEKQSEIDAKYISSLQSKLDSELRKHGIKLSKFHGVTTISTWLLAKTKARKEYNSYRHRRQLSGELYRAIMQSYYGGRAEQFKIGTFNQNIYVYDINSAYASACSKLPVLLSKPVFTNAYDFNAQFSVWHCDYDFSGIDLYFGLLPNRDTGNGIKYKVRGKGYFWQPEISFILKYYPECIRINHGFVLPYKQANFTQGILDLYKLRVELQDKNDPLQKVIGLALSALYGKFCQRDGAAYYYNFMYAGYITSHTRAQLLEATKGNGDKVICFLTDAIHSIIPINGLSLSSEIGEYKQAIYASGTYLDNGVYRFLDRSGNIVKEKSKGFRLFDFGKALSELQEKRTYTALAEFFIGHNLYSFMPIRFNEYLQIQKENKKTNPFTINARVFNSLENIDLTKEWIESKTLDLYSGRESSLYKERYYKEADVSKDSIMAGKI